MKNFKLGLFAYVMKNVGMKSDKNSISSTPTADAEAGIKNTDTLQRARAAMLKEKQAQAIAVDPVAATPIVKKQMQASIDIANIKTTEVQKVTANTKAQIAPLKRELLENAPIVQDYAPHINLGSALELITKQAGTPAQKLAAAKSVVEKSGIASGARNPDENKTPIDGYVFSRSQTTPTESDQSRNSKRAIEAYKLIGFIDALAKDPKMQDRLLTSNIPADRMVDKNSLLDLMMDFDDDGVLESINSTDKSNMWKRMKSALGFGTAMQSEFMGENQARNSISKPQMDAVLAKYNIVQGPKESLPDFAKRARSVLLLRADMIRSTDMSATADATMYKNNLKNEEALANTTKIVTKLKESIVQKCGPGAALSESEVNSIAKQMSANILRWITTVGVGSVNMDTLLAKMGQAVVTGSGPGIKSFLALDETVVVNILKSERLKLGGSAGAGVSAASGDIVPFAHVGVNGQLTVLDKADLENLSKMKGNFTIGAGVNAGLNFQNGLSVSPVPSLDIKWDDRIDSLENTSLRLGRYLDAVTEVDAKGVVKLNLDKKLPNTNKKLSEIIDPSLMDALNMLKSVIETGGGELSPDQQVAHAILMKERFLGAFRLSLGAEGKLGGFVLSGVKFLFLPGALGFGPTFQNIGVERKAEVVKGNTKKLSEANLYLPKLLMHGLSLEGENTLVRLEPYKEGSIVLQDGLEWKTVGNKKVMELAPGEAFKISENLQSDSLGSSIGTITIGREKAPTVAGPTVDTKVTGSELTADLPASKLDIGDALLKQIYSINIDKDIARPQVQEFMRYMTAGDAENANKSMKKAFGAIYTAAEKTGKLPQVMEAVDALLVGDNVTRGFNRAKSNDAEFKKYQAILIAKAPAALKAGLKKMTRESMTIGDIAFAFNRPELRKQELDVMTKAFGWKPSTDKEIIDAFKVADQDLIRDISSKKELKTGDDNYGYLLMARNRTGKGLQGARHISHGGYLARKEVSMPLDKKMEALSKMKGINELVKNAIVNGTKNESLQTELKSLNASQFQVGNNGKVDIALQNGKMLHLDMSASKISAALYGDIQSGKANAVCLNVSGLIQPSISSYITEKTGTVVPGTSLSMYLTEETVGNPGEVVNREVSVIGLIPKPAESAPPVKPPTDNSPSKTPDNKPNKTDNAPNKTPDNTPNKIDNAPNKTDNAPSKTDNSPSKTDNAPSKTDNSPSKTDNSPSKIPPGGLTTVPGTGTPTAPATPVVPVTGPIVTPVAPPTITTPISIPTPPPPGNVDNTTPVDVNL